MTHSIVPVVAGTGGVDSYSVRFPEQTDVAVPLSGQFWVEYVDGTGHHLQLLNALSGAVVAAFAASVFNAGGFTTPRGMDVGGGCYVNGAAGNYICTSAGGTPDSFTTTHDDSSSGMFGDVTGTVWGISSTDQSAAKITAINLGAHTSTETLATGASRQFASFARNAAGITGRVYGFSTAAGSPIRYIDTTALTGTDIIASSDGTSVVVGGDSNIYSATNSGGNTTVRQHDKDGALLQSVVVAGVYCVSLYDANGFVWLSGVLGALDFKKIDPVTMTVAETVANSTYLRILGEPFAGIPVCFNSTPPGAFAIITPNVTLGVTGVSGTGAVGSLGVGTRSFALTGVGAVASVGTLIAAPLLALTGLAATGSVGDLAVTNIQALAGNLATGSPGTLGVQTSTNVTVALTGVQGVGAVGTLTAQGGAWPSPPFDIQVLLDGPRNIALKVAASISVDFPQSLLIDPMARSSIIPGWPTDRKATKLAVDLLSWNIPSGLRISLWWAAPVPELIVELEGVGHLNLTSKGFLQNITAGSPGQVLISSSGLSGTQTFSLVLRLIKQGAFG